MKKKLLLLTCLSLMVASSYAQEQQQEQIVNYRTSRIGDNWFLSVGAGGTVYLGAQNSGEFLNRLRPVAELSIGKWITPSVGVRLQGVYTPSFREYSVIHTSPFKEGEMLQKFNYMGVHSDFMLNLSSAIGGYKEDRVYEIIPYFGPSWSHINLADRPTYNEISVAGGIINRFRLSRTVDANLEMRAIMIHGRMDHSTVDNRLDFPVSVSAGITVRLGRNKDFKVVPYPDYTPYNKRIKSLEDDLTSLEGKNKKLQKELEDCNNKPAVEKVVTKYTDISSPCVLFFGLNKYKLTSRELTNLEYFVVNTLKKSPDKRYIIWGAADKETGTAAYNQVLSQKRAEFVLDILVNKYGLARDRFTIKAVGSSDNRFKEAQLNRVVIIE